VKYGLGSVTKVSADDTVPCGAILFIELFLYMLCNIFLHTVFLKCLTQKQKQKKKTFSHTKISNFKRNPDTKLTKNHKPNKQN
jgi:hypothetical protein